MNLKIFPLVLVASLALLFTLQNVGVVTISIFFWEVSLSLAILIYFILAVGFTVGWCLHSFLVYRKNKKDVAEIQANLRTGKK
jgi:hypothetical protein